jgi:superfamily II DNA helicase RecQ
MLSRLPSACIVQQLQSAAENRPESGLKPVLQFWPHSGLNRAITKDSKCRTLNRPSTASQAFRFSRRALPLLKQYFGFSSFRPLQEEIVGDALAGRHVFAGLPTGGGGSFCYQLPAHARDGLPVVIFQLVAR